MLSSIRFTLALAAAVVVLGALLLFRGAGPTEAARGADVALSCGATQRAVVKQTVNAGTPHVDIQCVDGGAPGQAATYVVDENGQLVSVPSAYAAPASGAAVHPAGALVAYAPVAAQPAYVPAVYRPQAAPVIVERAASPVRTAARTTARSTRAVRQQGPSWQKRALVIGGSAGAGAGVGALVGGKKGALIGAAIGGGGAALVDALKDDD